MEIRSIFKNIFNSNNQPQAAANAQALKMLNTYQDIFTESQPPQFVNDITIATCVDTIARHISKLKPLYLIDGATAQDDINYLLSHRPNIYMNTHDFLYKITSKLLLQGNCFIYVKRDDTGRIISLNPLDYSSLELKEYDGNIYCKFSFAAGDTITVDYQDIIHLKANYRDGEILGSAPHNILRQQIKLLDTCKKSLENVVKNSTAINGYLKYNVLIKKKDKEAAAQEFNDIAKNGGVAVVDGDADYKDLSKQPLSTDTEQLDFIRNDILRFFGVSNAIINGDYNDTQYQSFFESVLEPLALQYSLEFTEKLFTTKQKQAGHEIVFSQNRLQYSSTQNKVDMIYKLLPQGILTINDALEILNLPPTDDETGNKRFMTLNNTTAANMADGKRGDKR